MIAALVIPADAPPYIAAITPDLDTLQSVVGGCIEVVRLADGILYCNEEGRLLGLPFNEAATTLARTTTPDSMNRQDVFAGTCLVVGVLDPATGEPSEEEQDVSDVLVGLLERQGWPLRQPD
ncbi:DUF3846 domain-containing protein [Nocardioides seonyuensis]|uniref:DUF3846 domain-containing protein n=1 Tax=Nocardioides seonyuensis TaxID=2518371 RepID=A0A4P7IJ89_9ACTN|nr:DUF3846 domain-containing protein [Nocardioides seonyuensis]